MFVSNQKRLAIRNRQLALQKANAERNQEIIDDRIARELGIERQSKGIVDMTKRVISGFEKDIKRSKDNDSVLIKNLMALAKKFGGVKSLSDVFPEDIKKKLQPIISKKEPDSKKVAEIVKLLSDEEFDQLINTSLGVPKDIINDNSLNAKRKNEINKANERIIEDNQNMAKEDLAKLITENTKNMVRVTNEPSEMSDIIDKSRTINQFLKDNKIPNVTNNELNKLSQADIENINKYLYTINVIDSKKLKELNTMISSKGDGFIVKKSNWLKAASFETETRPQLRNIKKKKRV